MEIEDGEVVSWLCRKPEFKLKELGGAIADENVHELVDSGDPAGREAL